MGKISGMDIQNCTWFLDRKPKNKIEEETSLPKRINLNCSDKFYIINFDTSTTPQKFDYKGKYAALYHKLKKGIVLEANCSITNLSKTGLEESSLEEKNSSVECFPYPHDIDKYTKERQREIVQGFFLYADNLEDLKMILASAEDEELNSKMIDTLEKEFNNEEKRKNQKSASSLIGRDFQFSYCEYIDFREIPIPNNRGLELQKKIDSLLETDLKSPANKEKLKESIDELFNCKEKCSSKEKEIIGFFELRNRKDNRTIIIQKKFKNKADLLTFKRFQFYPVEGKLTYIDFSQTGTVERIFLE